MTRRGFARMRNVNAPRFVFIALALALFAARAFAADAGPGGKSGGGKGGITGKKAVSPRERTQETGTPSAVGILIPRETFVGDSAELSFTTGAFNALLSPGAEEIVPQDLIAVSPDATVESVTVRRGESSSTVVVRFVPWVTGLLKLPPFSLAKVRVTPPPVRISSLSEKTGVTTLEPPRPPLLVPGTTFALYAIAALVLAAVACLAVTASRARVYLARNSATLRSRRRVSLATRELKYLARAIRKTDILSWYALFAAALRRYLGSLVAGNTVSLASATTREIARSLTSSFASGARSAVTAGAEIELAIARTEALLSAIDIVRFSGREESDTRPRDLAEARAVIDALERCAASVAGEEDADVQS